MCLLMISFVTTTGEVVLCFSIPRLEEGCLVRSGLVKLLDHLCSLTDAKKPLEVGGAADESLHRVTSLSWASFQVLAEQCVSWESQNTTTLSTGLAQQVRRVAPFIHLVSSALTCLNCRSSPPPPPHTHTHNYIWVLCKFTLLSHR